MDSDAVRRVRSFNRAVTQTVGALETSYLRRGRPLGEARLLFEIGRDGAEARRLRQRLGLDSGYLSRLLASLTSQGLIEVRAAAPDRRLRRVALTRKGIAELMAYGGLSDRLAASMLVPLSPGQQRRLIAAMGEVERLLGAASVAFAAEAPDSADARWCLDQYYNELMERFEQGYDPAKEGAASAGGMAPPAGLFLVARLHGEPVGCGGLRRIDATTGEIKRVWITPSARGLGVATRLLQTLEEAGRDIGLTKVPSRHQPRAQRSPGPLSQPRLLRGRALQRQPLRTSLVREAALALVILADDFGPPGMKARLRSRRIRGAARPRKVASGSRLPCAAYARGSGPPPIVEIGDRVLAVGRERLFFADPRHPGVHRRLVGGLQLVQLLLEIR